MPVEAEGKEAEESVLVVEADAAVADSQEEVPRVSLPLLWWLQARTRSYVLEQKLREETRSRELLEAEAAAASPTSSPTKGKVEALLRDALRDADERLEELRRGALSALSSAESKLAQRDAALRDAQVALTDVQKQVLLRKRQQEKAPPSNSVRSTLKSLLKARSNAGARAVMAALEGTAAERILARRSSTITPSFGRDAPPRIVDYEGMFSSARRGVESAVARRINETMRQRDAALRQTFRMQLERRDAELAVALADAAEHGAKRGLDALYSSKTIADLVKRHYEQEALLSSDENEDLRATNAQLVRANDELRQAAAEREAAERRLDDERGSLQTEVLELRALTHDLKVDKAGLESATDSLTQLERAASAESRASQRAFDVEAATLRAAHARAVDALRRERHDRAQADSAREAALAACSSAQAQCDGEGGKEAEKAAFARHAQALEGAMRLQSARHAAALNEAIAACDARHADERKKRDAQIAEKLRAALPSSTRFHSRPSSRPPEETHHHNAAAADSLRRAVAAVDELYGSVSGGRTTQGNSTEKSRKSKPSWPPPPPASRPAPAAAAAAASSKSAFSSSYPRGMNADGMNVKSASSRRVQDAPRRGAGAAAANTAFSDAISRHY